MDTVKSSGCSPSFLKYNCSSNLGDLVLHYSLGGSAPSNECTGAAEGASAFSGPNALHIAAEVAVTGYVSLAFANEAGE